MTWTERISPWLVQMGFLFGMAVIILVTLPFTTAVISVLSPGNWADDTWFFALSLFRLVIWMSIGYLFLRFYDWWLVESRCMPGSI